MRDYFSDFDCGILWSVQYHMKGSNFRVWNFVVCAVPYEGFYDFLSPIWGERRKLKVPVLGYFFGLSTIDFVFAFFFKVGLHFV